MKRDWTAKMTHHFSYKLVSLFIALILWLTILGRRDFILNKNVDVDFVTAPGYSLMTQGSDHVRVKVSGPRTALRKFMGSGMSSSVTIDISERKEGVYEVEIPANKVDAPLGVKVLEVKPRTVRVEIVKSGL
jgi:YbbR domain-containing protein